MNKRLVAGLAAPNRGALALALVLLLAESGAALCVPWLGGALVARLLEGGGMQRVAALILAALLAQALLRFATEYVLDSVAQRMSGDLRVCIYDRIQCLPMGEFHRRGQGEFLALITTDAYTVGGYVSHTLTTTLPLVVTAVGAGAMMFAIDPQVAAWIVMLLPLYFLFVKVVARSVRPASRDLLEQEAKVVGMARENIALMAEIKSFTREPLELTRFGAAVARLGAMASRQRVALAGLGPAMHFFAAASVVLLVAFTGKLTQGASGVAALASLFLYGQLLARPLASLADVYGQTQVMRAALARIDDLMRQPFDEAMGLPALPPVHGDIEFRCVGFSYAGRRPVLRDFSLRVAAGETVAVVGENGAGKSTVAQLLARMYDPHSGNILIDGTDIAGVTRQSVRSQVGLVPQHVLLLNASIAENIAYGRHDADRLSIIAAAKAAALDALVARLPDGYDTIVGENGVQLSGGERQRVALARALLKDPPLLVLDEATAMLDPQGEADFLEACAPALRGRTVLWITHRSAPLAFATRVVRVVDGAVAADVRRVTTGERLRRIS